MEDVRKSSELSPIYLRVVVVVVFVHRRFASDSLCWRRTTYNRCLYVCMVCARHIFGRMTWHDSKHCVMLLGDDNNVVSVGPPPESGEGERSERECVPRREWNFLRPLLPRQLNDQHAVFEKRAGVGAGGSPTNLSINLHRGVVWDKIVGVNYLMTLRDTTNYNNVNTCLLILQQYIVV